MNITEIAKTPELEEVILDDQEIVDAYGEKISFWMFDNVGINTYFDFFKFQSTQDGEALMAVLRKVILTPDGEPALKESDVLPMDVVLAAMSKISEHLGKSRAKLSKKAVGNSQE
jgi:hypothetical protein